MEQTDTAIGHYAPDFELPGVDGAEKTPHVFLLNQAGVLCYKGRVGNDPNNAIQGAGRDLRVAISQVLSQQPVTQAVTDPIGCSIKWRL